LRRTKCIITASGIVTVRKHPYACLIFHQYQQGSTDRQSQLILCQFIACCMFWLLCKATIRL